MGEYNFSDYSKLALCKIMYFFRDSLSESSYVFGRWCKSNTSSNFHGAPNSFDFLARGKRQHCCARQRQQHGQPRTKLGQSVSYHHLSILFNNSIVSFVPDDYSPIPPPTPPGPLEKNDERRWTRTPSSVVASPLLQCRLIVVVVVVVVVVGRGHVPRRPVLRIEPRRLRGIRFGAVEGENRVSLLCLFRNPPPPPRHARCVCWRCVRSMLYSSTPLPSVS